MQQEIQYKMASIFSNDPDDYWVKVVYDSGREEVIDHLRLNEAYNLVTEKEHEQKAQQKLWKRQQVKDPITKIMSGRL